MEVKVFDKKRYVSYAELVHYLKWIMIKCAKEQNKLALALDIMHWVTDDDEHDYLDKHGKTPESIMDYWDEVREEHYKDKWVVEAKIDGKQMYFVSCQGEDDYEMSESPGEAQLFSKHEYAQLHVDTLKKKGYEAQAIGANLYFCQRACEKLLNAIFKEENGNE